MEKNIKVSVLMLAYNHGKYIAKAIESVIGQKFDCPFELIIHDDASTDNTQEVIQEYAKKYPNIIRAIYQKENQFSKGVKIIHSILGPSAKGEYLCYLEGDDFWIDEHKLQEQYDFLRTHPEYSAVASRRKAMNESEEIIPYLHFKKDYVYNEKSVFHMPEMIHISTVMHTNIYDDERIVEKYDQLNKTKAVGDWILLIFLADSGSIYVSKKKYSAIRRVLRPDASNYNSIMKYQRNRFDVLKNRFVLDCAMKDFPFDRIHYKYSKPKNAAKFLFESLRANKKEKEYARMLYKSEYLPRMSKTEAISAKLLLWYPIYDYLKEKSFAFKCKHQTKSELGKKVRGIMQ